MRAHPAQILIVHPVTTGLVPRIALVFTDFHLDEKLANRTIAG
jgi:hypothetical protein